VRANCPDEDGLFPYLQFYYCNLRHVQPLAFIILVLWLSLLFSTIGIAASDFLCINLSTIASILGMSESLTGVTFLAFGNGSPDVFSTFAAMSSNSGSLAVGELIGAACFITTVVAGSMAVVRPFRVARRSFVRDVGYFIIAASFSMVALVDGKLHIWECTTMVGLYLFYVLIVVLWHWYLTRQRRRYERDLAARAHFHIPNRQELDLQQRAPDDDPIAGESRSLLHGSSTADFEALERTVWPAWKDDEDDETRNRYLAEIRENMHVSRPIPSRRRPTINPIRPSLVGALEFQSVLSSLQRSKNLPNDLIDLRRYTDDPSAPESRHRDNLSIFSHPPETTGSSTAGQEEDRRSRHRSVSMNDAPARVRYDPSAIDSRDPPSGNGVLYAEPGESSQAPETSPGFQDGTVRIDPSAMLTASPTSSTSPSRSQSPAPTGQVPSSDRLAVPTDLFRTPNYQASPHSLGVSPGGVSPGGVSPLSAMQVPQISISSEPQTPESPTVPFPPFDNSGSFSSKALSIRLPPASFSSSEMMEADEHFIEDIDQETKRWMWWPYWFLPPPWLLISTLFPTLYNWQAKNVWEKLLGIVAAPSVFLLTVTIPVVEPKQSESESDTDFTPQSAENEENEQRPLIQLPDDSPILPPQSSELSGGQQNLAPTTGKNGHRAPLGMRPRFDSEMPVAQSQPSSDSSPPSMREWHRWLVSVQLFTSPLFVILVGWLNLDTARAPRNLLISVLFCLPVSLLCIILLNMLLKERNSSQPPSRLRPLLAFLGFIVGICWIATIADEVVSVLKTVGVILNISDSLLGLTIFAVGNSLGDLVADITVARLGYPVMALSACFGGPMLNILLGIGVGGLYMTLHSKTSISHAVSVSNAATDTYHVTISKTLAISGVTLLVTLVGLLIIVPLNHWRMDRKIGYGLVALWTISTLGNVIAEIVS
jgi:sodium/potassium/calcium exchanger 6